MFKKCNKIGFSNACDYRFSFNPRKRFDRRNDRKLFSSFAGKNDGKSHESRVGDGRQLLSVGPDFPDQPANLGSRRQHDLGRNPVLPGVAITGKSHRYIFRDEPVTVGHLFIEPHQRPAQRVRFELQAGFHVAALLGPEHRVAGLRPLRRNHSQAVLVGVEIVVVE